MFHQGAFWAGKLFAGQIWTDAPDEIVPPEITGELVAVPASVTLSIAGGPVAIAISDGNGTPLPASRALAATATVTKPGYATPSRTFVSGILVLTPVGVGSGVVTVTYGDQVDDEKTVTIPFTVTA